MESSCPGSADAWATKQYWAAQGQSNIAPYGADGNGDGIVNLYTPEDAVASLANYLAKHGWKKNGSRALKHRVLMRYNKSTRYANTILELASLTAKRAGKTR